MKVVSPHQIIGTLLLAGLLCLGASANEIHQPAYLSLDKQTDFAVYYTAASLIRDHLGRHLYDEAADGSNPQRREARSGGVFLNEARRRGLQRMNLYLYPPFFAEMLVPLAPLSIRMASIVWRLLGCSMVLLSAGCLSRLLGMRWLSVFSLAVLTGFCCFSPLWQALHYGQVTLILLGLLSLGILTYHEGWKRTSALLCAVAALIKLTPLVLLAPMIVWREWRWVRWFGSVFVVGLVLSNALPVSGMVATFFLHVVPPMSNGILSRENQTLLSATQMMWCHGRNVAGLIVPRPVLWIGKSESFLLLAAGCWMISPVGPSLAPERRSLALVSFVSLSLCAAPVAWIDTQVFGYLLLVLVSAELLRRPGPLWRLTLVFTCTVCMGGSLALKSIPWVRSVTPLQYLPLIASIVLAMYALAFTRKTFQTEAR